MTYSCDQLCPKTIAQIHKAEMTGDTGGIETYSIHESPPATSSRRVPGIHITSASETASSPVTVFPSFPCDSIDCCPYGCSPPPPPKKLHFLASLAVRCGHVTPDTPHFIALHFIALHRLHFLQNEGLWQPCVVR